MDNSEHGDIERKLGALGGLPVPDPDEMTVARIEARWRTAIGQPARRTARAGVLARRPAAVGAAALVLAAAASVAVVVTVGSPDTGQDTAAVADVQGVTVVLPSGEVITPAAGEDLPEGAIVEAGTGAQGVVGNQTVIPLTRYVVRNGRLVPEGTVPETPTPDSAALAPSTSSASSTSNAVSTVPSSSSTSEVTTTTVTPLTPVRLAVSAVASGKKARISWSAFGGPDVKEYVVYRVKSWNGSSLPKGKRIATIRPKRGRVAVDQHPQSGTFYVVAALGPKRTVLAIGSVRSPDIVKRKKGATP
jgi:hypothetical protein